MVEPDVEPGTFCFKTICTTDSATHTQDGSTKYFIHYSREIINETCFHSERKKYCRESLWSVLLFIETSIFLKNDVTCNQGKYKKESGEFFGNFFGVFL